MRKLASIRKIDRIDPIKDADAIEVATLGGWKVVIRKGEFKEGDLAVYLEIDSWVPYELAPFLSKGKDPREFNGVKGERLRTVKLRGQLSQGLLLSLEGLEPLAARNFSEDQDISNELRIQKWEAPINAQLAGEVRGSFPGFVPKTDQERIQNLAYLLPELNGRYFEFTEKLDGSSMTIYNRDGEIGVCSRNLDLKENYDNSFWKVAKDMGLLEKISTLSNLAFQGELIGPGIQKNPYKLPKHEFRLFDIYDISAGEYLTPEKRRDLADNLEILHVPVITIRKLGPEDTMESLIAKADGRSFMNPMDFKLVREGLVLKSMDGGCSFKVISNEFLLKGGD